MVQFSPLHLYRFFTDIPCSMCSGRTVVCSAHCRPTVKQYSVPTVRAVNTLFTHCRRQCALRLHCGNYGLELLQLAVGTVENLTLPQNKFLPTFLKMHFMKQGETLLGECTSCTLSIFKMPALTDLGPYLGHWQPVTPEMIFIAFPSSNIY